MTKCLIIGGGFAGLSAGSFLADKGIKVHLLEASPKLGGRAYSFPYNNSIIDNGQHIMMGCYKNTIDFLKLINSEKEITFQKNLSINFVKRGGKTHKLDSSKLFYPVNLLNGILNYKALNLGERLSVMKLFFKLAFLIPNDFKNLSAYDWLKAEGQSSNTLSSLWEIIIVGTLNTTPEKASASILISVLKEIFLTGRKSSVIVFPNAGLSEMYCLNSRKFIEEKGGKIFLSEKVTGVEFHNRKAVKVISNKDVYSDYDFVISTVPHYSFINIFGDSIPAKGDDVKIEYSPILTVHLWLKENPFSKFFYGLIDSEVHWLFNHGDHITLVTSAAESLILKDEEEIFRIICSELENYFPIFYKNFVTKFLVLKEKRATFIPSVNLTKHRHKLEFSYKNVLVAGDWTNTGLPSTIEGAVLSGRKAAYSVFSNKR